MLDAGGDEEDGALEFRREDDVDDVIGHHVCAGVLRPLLHGEAGKSSLPHPVVDGLAPSLGSRALGSKDQCDFFPFSDWVGDVASRLDVGEDSGWLRSMRPTFASQRGDLGRKGRPPKQEETGGVLPGCPIP